MVLIAALRSYGRQKYSFAREAPFLTTPDGVQYFSGVRHAVAKRTMQPSQSEMQHLGRVEFSALESDWAGWTPSA